MPNSPLVRFWQTTHLGLEDFLPEDETLDSPPEDNMAVNSAAFDCVPKKLLNNTLTKKKKQKKNEREKKRKKENKKEKKEKKVERKKVEEKKRKKPFAGDFDCED